MCFQQGIFKEQFCYLVEVGPASHEASKNWFCLSHVYLSITAGGFAVGV